MNKLETIEIYPKTETLSTVIWMHGLGADGHDFVDIVSQLNLPHELAVKFIFPHAPLRQVTFANNELLRAWFDISELSTHGAEYDEQGIYDSQIMIDAIITREIANGIDAKKIILAGFSQGGAMALQCGLHNKHKLGGIMVLSGFLLFANKLSIEKSDTNYNTPVFMMHGSLDHVVSMPWAELSYNKLKSLGFNATWKSYPMYHTVCQEQIKDISDWMILHLNAVN